MGDAVPLQLLDDKGSGTSAAVADAGAAKLALLEQRRERDGNSAPGGANRVAEGNGATGNVDLGRVEVEDLLVGEHHGGEGLVDLVQGNVVDGDPGHGQGARDGLGGSGGELLGVVGGVAKAADDCEGLEAEGGGLLAAHEEEGAGAVVELGGVGGGDGADLLEGGLEGGDLVKLDALVLLVLRDHGVGLALGSRNGDGDDFVAEEAALREYGKVLRRERERERARRENKNRP